MIIIDVSYFQRDVCVASDRTYTYGCAGFHNIRHTIGSLWANYLNLCILETVINTKDPYIENSPVSKTLCPLNDQAFDIYETPA